MTRRNPSESSWMQKNQYVAGAARRHGGALVFSERDAEGVLEVVDAFGVRSLHFGTSPRQSAMALDNPERLELAYVRAMLAALIFVPVPHRVLLLGLGGGSLARFLISQFDQCSVDAVERRPGVVDIARTYFGLPRDARLSIEVAEAVEHTESLARVLEAAYDLILVDAYDHQGMDSSVNAEEFFSACARLLRPTGVVSINLWGSHNASLRQSTDLLKHCFPGKAYRLPVPNKGNVIGLGLGRELPKPDPVMLLPRAKALEIQMGIEMPYFLRNLKSL